MERSDDDALPRSPCIATFAGTERILNELTAPVPGVAFVYNGITYPYNINVRVHFLFPPPVQFVSFSMLCPLGSHQPANNSTCACVRVTGTGQL